MCHREQMAAILKAKRKVVTTQRKQMSHEKRQVAAALQMEAKALDQRCQTHLTLCLSISKLLWLSVNGNGADFYQS